MASWQGSLIATLNKYIKGKIDSFDRRSVLYMMLKQNGRIVTGAPAAGENTVWNVQHRLPTTQVYEDMAFRNAGRTNLLKQASLPWGLYDCPSALSKFDLLKNKGEAEMTNLLAMTAASNLKSMEQRISQDLYADGAGTNQIHGFNTWSGSGATLSNGVFNPSDTYATLSTALGNYGGTAPTGGTWPDGVTLTPQYDFWSPLLVSSTSTAFGATNTWAANCRTILRKTKIWADNKGAENRGPTTAVMSANYYNDLKAALEVTEMSTFSDAHAKLTKFGFPAIEVEGMAITHEYWCPSSCVFGINWDVLELRSLQDDVFHVDEKLYNDADKSWKLGADAYIQLVHYALPPMFKIAEYGS